MLLLLASALAETPVLVSAFQARNAEAAGLAGLLEDYLGAALEGQPELGVVRIEDTPSFRDYAARVYMDGCPPGDIVGCTQVVAERAEVPFAVTGTVTALADGSRVQVDILDVRESRVAVSFRSELALGEDKVFADGVAQVLLAVLRGEAGQEEDIRDDEQEGSTVDNDAVAAQLRELSDQLQSASMAIAEEPREIVRPTYTEEDLASQMATEGSKPWERLGMTPGAWLRYQNSGLSLFEWRQRAAGRHGQLLVRGHGAWWNGPVKGKYYARYAIDDALQTVDSYAAQYVTLGSAAGGGLGVGYGLTPFLDVGLAFSVFTGSYEVDVGDQQVGRPPEYSEPVSLPASHFVVGPRATVAFLPVSSFRPTATFGVDYVQQHAVTEFYEMPPQVHVFPASPMVLASLVPGFEVSLSRRLDFTLRLPIDILLAGAAPLEERTGAEAVVTPLTPSATPPVTFRVEAGLQVRALGKDVERDAVYEDEP